MIEQDGWRFETQTGSHRHFVHPVKPGKVSIPMHNGDIPIGTLRNILKQAGLL